ncbi:MAG: PA2169 family four-helix-bundle protein [Pyrinomonadaceae bacterium]|nr:PA2169 family four-helix-bundle protein [Pyrinomonadaceae bacterium]
MINDYEATRDITDQNYAASTTPVSNDGVISTLNGLVETCKDGQEGFKQAAEGIESSSLKSVFYEIGQQRARYAGELQALVREMGGDPETTSSTAGALHRSWINIKSLVTGKDEAGILNEVERGEDSAKKAYKDALAENLPANVKTVVQKQADEVMTAHDKIRDLRDSANAATT